MLKEIAVQIGEEETLDFILLKLIEFNKMFAGRGQMATNQLKLLSQRIFDKYGDFKMGDLDVFSKRFEDEKVHGQLSPNVFLGWVRIYRDERIDAAGELELDEHLKRKEASKKIDMHQSIIDAMKKAIESKKSVRLQKEETLDTFNPKRKEIPFQNFLINVFFHVFDTRQVSVSTIEKNFKVKKETAGVLFNYFNGYRSKSGLTEASDSSYQLLKAFNNDGKNKGYVEMTEKVLKLEKGRWEV